MVEKMRRRSYSLRFANRISNTTLNYTLRKPKFFYRLRQTVIKRAPQATIPERVLRLSRFLQTLTAKKDAEVFQ